MKHNKREKDAQSPATGGSIPNRILGSLRDALAAASRDATGEITVGERTEILPKEPAASRPGVGHLPAVAASPSVAAPAPQTAAEAVREAKTPGRSHYEAAELTTRVVRGGKD